MPSNVSLVLEGGGMKGVFTAGVLDYFMEQNLYFPYVIGVSAGACHAASYISRQPGRSKEVNIGYIKDPRYLSWRNYVRERSLIGMSFVFGEIPNKLVPFDYQTFAAAQERLVTGTTNCETGAPVYFDKDEADILEVLKASSSLPFASPIVYINGVPLLDGGISDPIPINKAMADGNHHNVVVLTKPPGYRLKPFRAPWLAKTYYRNYPGIVQAMLKRHEVYNQSLDLVEQLEQQGQVFVLRPQSALKVGRLENSPDKLMILYHEGYDVAKQRYSQLMEWLKS